MGHDIDRCIGTTSLCACLVCNKVVGPKPDHSLTTWYGHARWPSTMQTMHPRRPLPQSGRFNSKACLHLVYTHSLHVSIISPKHSSTLNTYSNDFICSILNMWHHVSVKIPSGGAVSGEGGVASEGNLVGVPQFHSWGKCTMSSTNIQYVPCFLWPVY